MSLRDIAARALVDRAALGEAVCASYADAGPTAGRAAIEPLGGGAPIATFSDLPSAQRAYALMAYAPPLAAFVLRVTSPEMQQRIAAHLRCGACGGGDETAAAIMRLLLEPAA